MDREKMGRVREILSRFPGRVPVYVNLPREGMTLLCPREIWVDDPEAACRALGDELPPQDMKAVRKS